MSNDLKEFSFWRWFVKGTGGSPGIFRIINWWLPFHLMVGLLLGSLVDLCLVEIANTVLLPLAGVLVGLSFAWSGNAMALLQSAEMEKLSEHHKGGFTEYVFTFQLAIFVILVTLIFWGLAGLKVFDKVWPTHDELKTYFYIKCVLFGLSSLTLRECWHVILGAQWMLIVQHKMRQNDKDKDQKSTS